MAIKTMTLDEVKKTALTKEQIEIIKNAKATPSDDCPELTVEQIKNLQSASVVRPEWFSSGQTPVQISIDNEVLEVLKKGNDSYQIKINQILRQAVLG